jgi:hypothetical protein
MAWFYSCISKGWKMKKIISMLLFGFMLCACSNQTDKQVEQQMQYLKTHTGYADSATLHYALDHEITPDSAVIVLRNGKQ